MYDQFNLCISFSQTGFIFFIACCVSVCCGDPLPVEGDEEFSSETQTLCEVTSSDVASSMTAPSLQHSADVHMLASAGFSSGLCWRLPTRPAALNISWSVWEQRWVSLHRLRWKSADDEKTQQSSVSAARRHDARRGEENKKQPCDCEGSAAGRKQVELNQTAKTLLLSLFRDTQVVFVLILCIKLYFVQD